MSNVNKEEIRERLGNIDQIRDIIFGAQLRDYDNRLSKIESDVSMLRQEVRDRLDQIRASLSTEFQTTVEALDKKLKSFSLAHQEEGADLRAQVDRLNRKFSGGIQILDEALDSQTVLLRQELGNVKTQIQEDTMALRNQVLEELDRRFSSLSETKASKDDLAETLFELGMRLKGTEFIPKLRETADNSSVYDSIPLLATRRMERDLSNSSEE